MSLLKANAVQLGQSLTASQNFTWYQPASPDGTVRLGNGNSGSVTDLVTLTSAGNLGIGTSSPSTKLTVYDASTPQVTFNNGTSSFIVGNNNGGNNHILYGTGAYPIIFYTNSAEAMRLDSSGNLGLGVTPSTWSQSKAFQINTIGALRADTGTVGLNNNAYYNAGWKYLTTGTATTYEQNSSGQHVWNIAPSGTAGNAISFTQAMTLDASGNLILNVGEYIRITGTTISVGTSATAITGAHSFGSTAIVRGINGGQIFGDLVFFSDSVVTVLASHGVSGGPAARTYTAVGGVLKLAMASGTYSVNVGITTVV